jgi:response regulator RpfG family c-di-GMP phosphodiesterase
MKPILIVDDLSQNLYMLEVLLTTNGYQVVTAVNGKQALDIAKNNPPEMIISDILMPVMDGFSLCRIWKADQILKKIPFIFYTATYTNPKDAELASSLGADAYLVKPMETDSFLAAIKNILQRKETFQPNTPKINCQKEVEFFKEYNEVLVHKLEDKMQELQKSNNRKAALYKVSTDLLTEKQFHAQINLITKALLEVGGYQFVNFFAYNEKQKNLTLLSSQGFSEEINKDLQEKMVIKVGEPKGIIGLVAQSRQTLYIPDTSKEPNWIPFDPSIKSAMYSIVSYNQSLIGVMGVYSQHSDAFGEEDEHDLSSLANNLAVAIENTKNQEQVYKQLSRISALHNIDMAISSSMDLPSTLGIFLNHVITLLQIDAADILLLHQFANTFEFAVGRGFTSSMIENDNIRKGKSLDKRVVSERNLIIVDRLSDLEVNNEFITMWKKENFSIYLGIPLIAKGQVVGILEVFSQKLFDPDPEWIDFFLTLGGQAAIAVDNIKMFSDLQQSNHELSMAYDATIKGWSRALDLRAQEPEGHTQRVTDMTIQMAELMGISGQNIIHIRRGCFLHDIGKLGVPDSILLKKTPLTGEEIELLRKHPQIAFELLQPIDFLRPALEIPFCHHERWDGSGYPRGLKGETIPLAARIFAVVHVWDVLLTNRPFRESLTEKETVDFLINQKNKYFDPLIVDKFLDMIKKFPATDNPTS